MRIAMWSGPRNLSTALMYCFGNRADCAIWDEPFYAPYLAATGLNHPMRDDIIAAHEADPYAVACMCARPDTQGKPHIYMKHMAHHMIEGFPLDWAKDCVNIHLIRHPAHVIASYGAKRDDVTFDDIGFAQQLAIFKALGGLVIDSADIRAHPEANLRRLCDAIRLPFDPDMLSWAAGPRAEDGVWAKHWYGAVHQSTRIVRNEQRAPELSGHQAQLLDQAMPYYEAMAVNRM